MPEASIERNHDDAVGRTLCIAFNDRQPSNPEKPLTVPSFLPTTKPYQVY